MRTIDTISRLSSVRVWAQTYNEMT